MGRPVFRPYMVGGGGGIIGRGGWEGWLRYSNANWGPEAKGPGWVKKPKVV